MGNMKNTYYKKFPALCPIEKYYQEHYIYAVSSIDYKIKEKRFDTISIFYPNEIKFTSTKQFPLVIMSNGTGVRVEKYKPILLHLSSWGFIVAGNNDDSSALGDSTSRTLDFILELNKNDDLFKNKIDLKNIGVAGHSQGGVGAINAITKFDNSKLYKCCCVASTTTESLINSFHLDSFHYDMSLVNIPLFMTCSTGNFDMKITPLKELKENYDKVNAPCVIGRRKDVDHGDFLMAGDAYFTAWFCYFLKNDQNAKNAFVGENAEIKCNSLWVDVESKNM